jgi:hypothetical protein
MIPKEIIIWGGGSSIKEGLALGLKDKLKDKFVIGINFSMYHFLPTVLTFADNPFYKGIFFNDKPHLIDYNHIEKLKQLPLIVGVRKTLTDDEIFPNTVLVKKSLYFNENPLRDGFRYILGGIFALQLTGYLTDWNSTVYCLGYDWTKKGTTHYYKDINHRGINKTSWYKTHSPDKGFDYFLNKPNFKVYNVSLNSNIECFEKINYKQMFEMLSEEKYNQKNLRQEVKEKLCIK